MVTPTVRSSASSSPASVPNSTRRGWVYPLAFVVQQLGSGVLLLFTLGLLLDLLSFQLTTLLFSAGALWLSTGIAALLRGFAPDATAVSAARTRTARWHSGHAVWSLVVLTGAWGLAEVATAQEWIDMARAEDWRGPVLWLATGLGLATLALPPLELAQARGYPLWRTPLAPVQWIVQALYAGSGFFLLLNGVLSGWRTDRFVLANGMSTLAQTAFGLLLFVNLCTTLVSVVGSLRESDAARESTERITRGPFRDIFWWGGVGLGHAVPLGLLLLDRTPVVAQAPLYSWVGLFCFQYAYFWAPQRVAAKEGANAAGKAQPEMASSHEQ